MGIYIKDIEMPASCDECPFCDGEEWCLIPGNWRLRYNIKHGERLSACPLVPIPPHGDLIDRNALMDSDGDLWDGMWGWSGVQIANAPAIIPADKSKEG